MQKILIVDDCTGIREFMTEALTESGYEALSAGSVADARAKLSSGDIDLILLDIELPDEDGLKFAGELTDRIDSGELVVIFVTGKMGVETKVKAFDLGADDYLSKPFEMAELKARVNARLKNRAAIRSKVLTRGPLTLDLECQKAWVSDKGARRPLPLTSSEFKLLYYLARNDDRSVAKEELFEKVWGPEVHVTDQTMYTHLSALRRKVKELGATIVSSPRSGYRFECPLN